MVAKMLKQDEEEREVDRTLKTTLIQVLQSTASSLQNISNVFLSQQISYPGNHFASPIGHSASFHPPPNYASVPGFSPITPDHNPQSPFQSPYNHFGAEQPN